MTALQPVTAETPSDVPKHFEVWRPILADSEPACRADFAGRDKEPRPRFGRGSLLCGSPVLRVDVPRLENQSLRPINKASPLYLDLVDAAAVAVSFLRQ